MTTLSQLQSIGIGILVACIAGLAMVASVLWGSSTQLVVPSSVGTLAQGTSTIPVRLGISALGIDAKVQQVGRTAAGLMGSPSNFKDVAWFKLGPQPGEMGSAVIAGHLDNALGLSGVFKNLTDLHIGDEVAIQTASKGIILFRVIGIEEYPYDQVPLETLFDKNDGAYLNLVTCAGTWLRNQKTYDRRVIVYTERVP